MWVWVNTYRYHILVGWTSIYQLFWGSLGTRVLTHPHVWYPNLWHCENDSNRLDLATFPESQARVSGSHGASPPGEGGAGHGQTAPPGEAVFLRWDDHPQSQNRGAGFGLRINRYQQINMNCTSWLPRFAYPVTLCQQGEPPWWKSNLAKPAFTSIFIHVHLILSICIFSQHVISTKLLTENCVDVLHLVSQLSDALTTSRWLGTTLQSWAWAMPSLANEQLLATVGALEKLLLFEAAENVVLVFCLPSGELT